MKTKEKFITLISVCILMMLSISTVVFADIDLSGMNYDELVALKDQINLAIWNSEDWQEVEVPQGVWEVGEDIPVGKWEIKALPGAQTKIVYGTEVKEGGTDVTARSWQRIKDENYRNYDSNEDVTSWIIEVEEGYYLQVEDGPAVFMPYNGKLSLGFK